MLYLDHTDCRAEITPKLYHYLFWWSDCQSVPWLCEIHYEFKQVLSKRSITFVTINQLTNHNELFVDGIFRYVSNANVFHLSDTFFSFNEILFSLDTFRRHTKRKYAATTTATSEISVVSAFQVTAYVGCSRSTKSSIECYRAVFILFSMLSLRSLSFALSSSLLSFVVDNYI